MRPSVPYLSRIERSCNEGGRERRLQRQIWTNVSREERTGTNQIIIKSPQGIEIWKSGEVHLPDFIRKQ